MNKAKVWNIIIELEKIGCHNTAKAMWQTYINW